MTVDEMVMKDATIAPCAKCKCNKVTLAYNGKISIITCKLCGHEIRSWSLPAAAQVWCIESEIMWGGGDYDA